MPASTCTVSRPVAVYSNQPFTGQRACRSRVELSEERAEGRLSRKQDFKAILGFHAESIKKVPLVGFSVRRPFNMPFGSGPDISLCGLGLRVLGSRAALRLHRQRETKDVGSRVLGFRAWGFSA